MGLIEDIQALYRLPERERPGAADRAVGVWRAGGNFEKAFEWAERWGTPGLAEAVRPDWERQRREQADRLRANLEAAGRGNVYSPQLEAWLADPIFSAATTWANAEGGVVWLHEEGTSLRVLAGPLDLNQRRLIREDAAKGVPLLLFGTGHGEVPLALCEKPKLLLWMKRAVYAVEPDLDLFLLSMRALDLREALSAPECFWFVGSDWEGVFRSVMARERMLPLPERRVEVRSSRGACERLVGEAAGIRRADQEREREQCWPEYESRTDADFARIFGGRLRPIRILLITSRFTMVLRHVIRDLSEAFAKLGCATDTAIETNDAQRLSSDEIVARVRAHRPDLVVQLDHLRPELGACLPERIPFACWIQDRLPKLFMEKFVSKLGDRDFVFAMWPAIRQECLARGYTRVDLLAAAANVETYRPPADPRPEFVCDVAFVSNIALPAPEPKYPGLVERAADVMTREGIGWRDPAFYGALLDRLSRELNLTVAAGDRARLVERVLAFDLERFVQRTQPVRWAMEMGRGLDVRVWGAGWPQIPEFREIAQGPVAPGPDLRDLYASARIHLQMNSDTNVHQRVFEVLSSGGFLLAWAHPGDRRPGGLDEHLAIGREVETFVNRADFEEKVRRYLADEPSRRTISEAGSARVLACHTTAHRASAILDRVRKHFSSL